LCIAALKALNDKACWKFGEHVLFAPVGCAHYLFTEERVQKMKFFPIPALRQRHYYATLTELLPISTFVNIT